MVTILIVPGAWLPVTTYRRLIRALEEQSFEVEFATYPSFNPKGDPSQASCKVDTAHIRDRMLGPLVEKGKDVVVVMHSYGGMPGSGAATGLGKRTRRAQGQSGGVIGLIMISAFAVAEGLRCVDVGGGSLAPWVLQNQPGPGLCLVEDANQVFAADVPEEMATTELSLIEPQAMQCFLSKQPRPAFQTPEFEGLLGYLTLRNDRAIPLSAQEAMIQNSGAKWKTRNITASHHAPFATRVEETVKVIDDFVADFRKAAS